MSSYVDLLFRNLERLACVTIALVALKESGAISWTDGQMASPFLIGLAITLVGSIGVIIFEKIMEWRRWR